MSNNTAKLAAMRDLLDAAKRNLQLVDERLHVLGEGRTPVEAAGDVSSEHRVSWLGAVDDRDRQDGVLIGSMRSATSYGFINVKTGKISNQEDAAFVCTNVMVAVAEGSGTNYLIYGFKEEPEPTITAIGFNFALVPMLRLTDGSSGRLLTPGNLASPVMLDNGFVPFSYFTSFRRGMGANTKNKMFSEFTIPRNGTIKVELVNASQQPRLIAERTYRAFVTLFGYKVYGA